MAMGFNHVIMSIISVLCNLFEELCKSFSHHVRENMGYKS